jgi:hypothetical protein
MPARFRQDIIIDHKCCTRCLTLSIAKQNFRLAEMLGPLMYFFQAHQVDKDPTLPPWAPDYTKDDPGLHSVIPASEGRTQFTASTNNIV